MPTDPGAPMTLEDYRRACEESTDEQQWRAGRVDYPGSMTIDLDESATYQAAVDIRDEPLPPEEVIDSESPKSKPVLVHCILSARLDAVGEGLEVESAGEGLGGWQARAFSPSGVAEWVWTVRATEPGDRELRLTLRPITTERDLINNVPVEQKSFTTAVAVEASFGQDLVQWFSSLKGILVAAGAAVVGLLMFANNAHDSVKGFRERFGRKPKPQEDPRPEAAKPRP